MSDYELSTYYSISNTEYVKICIDEDELKLLVFNSANAKVGQIELTELDYGYYICWMYMDMLSDTYKHKGIGRAALRFFKNVYKMPIYANEDNGMVSDDGSHLTGDAPNFIRKMRQEGIVS